ncbi:MAG: hypothetical protein ABIE94_04405, partial [archaeon]
VKTFSQMILLVVMFVYLLLRDHSSYTSLTSVFQVIMYVLLVWTVYITIHSGVIFFKNAKKK